MIKTATFPAIPKTCSPQQAKYLRDRVSHTSPPYRSVRGDREDEPKEIRDARKAIDRWEIDQRKEANKRSQVFDKAKEAAQRAILFKTPEVALAAVEAYEKVCKDAKDAL